MGGTPRRPSSWKQDLDLVAHVRDVEEPSMMFFLCRKSNSKSSTHQSVSDKDEGARRARSITTPSPCFTSRVQGEQE